MRNSPWISRPDNPDSTLALIHENPQVEGLLDE